MDEVFEEFEERTDASLLRIAFCGTLKIFERFLEL